MLEAIVGDHDVHSVLGKQTLRGRDPVGPRDDRATRAASEQHGLVADLVAVALRVDDTRPISSAAAIPACHDADAQAARLELRREPNHERRLTGAADAHVADDDDRNRQLDRFQQIAAIGDAAQLRERLVDRREREQRPAQRAVAVPQGVQRARDGGPRAAHPSPRELHAMQRRVVTAARDELRVRALLDDRALAQRDDQIGLLDRRQPMRDHERRAPLHQTRRERPARGAPIRCRAPTSPRRGSAPARLSATRARSRSAAAVLPRASHRARRRASRAPPAARMRTPPRTRPRPRPRSPRAATSRASRKRCCPRCCRRTARRPGSRARAAGVGRAAGSRVCRGRRAAPRRCRARRTVATGSRSSTCRCPIGRRAQPSYRP